MSGNKTQVARKVAYCEMHPAWKIVLMLPVSFCAAFFESQCQNTKSFHRYPYIGVIELAREVRTGKILVSFFVAGLWTEPQARSINLQKKNETNIFPERILQICSIKFLFIMAVSSFLTARHIGLSTSWSRFPKKLPVISQKVAQKSQKLLFVHVCNERFSKVT